MKVRDHAAMKRLQLLICLFLTFTACGSPGTDTPMEPIDEVPAQCAPAGTWDLDFTFNEGSCGLFDASAVVEIAGDDEQGYSASVDGLTEGVTVQVDESCAVHVTEIFEALSHIDSSTVTWTWTYAFWRIDDTAEVGGVGDLALAYLEGDPHCDQTYELSGAVAPSAT